MSERLWMREWVAVAMLGIVVFGARAQGAAPVAAKARGAGAGGARQVLVKFLDGKAVLGVPTSSVGSGARCASDGTTFFEVYQDSLDAGPLKPTELYSVSPSGEARHMQRKLPTTEFTQVTVRDFFPADHTLVTLVKAEWHDGDEKQPVRETRYFLSLEDHDGDHAELLRLDVRFRPLKVGMFWTGDFLVLGWDAGNELPVLALVKNDGTVRRFLDLDDKHVAMPYGVYDTLKEAEASAHTRANLMALEGAVFVPFGGSVLLTYPGTTRFVRILNAMGEAGAIPIAFPAGQVLHDVLVTSPRNELVVRTEEPRDPAKAGAEVKHRMFEFSAYTGALLREMVFEKPLVDTVTCAANQKLTSVYMDTVADVVKSGSGDDAKSSEATQMVVATFPR